MHRRVQWAWYGCMFLSTECNPSSPFLQTKVGQMNCDASHIYEKDPTCNKDCLNSLTRHEISSSVFICSISWRTPKPWHQSAMDGANMIKAHKLYQITNQCPVDKNDQKIPFLRYLPPLPDPKLLWRLMLRPGGFTQFNHPKKTAEIPKDTGTMKPPVAASHISCKSDLAGREELASEEDVLSKPTIPTWNVAAISKLKTHPFFHSSEKKISKL